MSEQPPDSGAPGSPQPPYNPYAQPPGPEPTQPLWQGHQAPPQASPASPGEPAPGAGRRRTWLIVLAVILFLALAGAAITAAVLVAAEDDDDPGIAVADIEAETCLDSDGLAEAGEGVGTIKKVGCDDEHDAEVFATLALAADEDLVDAADNCVGELADVGQTWAALDADGIEVRPLVAGENAGDKVVCFIRHRNGEPLTGSEFEFE